MAALPYMQLYVAEYLADTTHLSAAQHGAYLLLLMNYWQRGKALPNNDDRLAITARMTIQEWNKNRQIISEFFEITETEWKHKRVETDLKSVGDKSETNKANGKRGGRPPKPNGYQNKTETKPNGLPNGFENESETKGNRTEQIKNRTEQVKTEPVLEPSMVASAVLIELALSSRDLIVSLEEVCRFEMRKGRDATELRDAMIGAYRDYQEAKAAGSLEFAKGVGKFFGEGDWRDKAGWPWKDGKRPRAARTAQTDVLTEIRERNRKALEEAQRAG